MTADEFFGLASQHRQPANGSPDKSARPAGGNRCRITSFVIATASTERHSPDAFARWAFATDRQRRDLLGRTVTLNDLYYRLYPTRVPRSCDRVRRATSAACAALLPAVLQRHPDTSRAGQRLTA